MNRRKFMWVGCAALGIAATSTPWRYLSPTYPYSAWIEAAGSKKQIIGVFDSASAAMEYLTEWCGIYHDVELFGFGVTWKKLGGHHEEL